MHIIGVHTLGCMNLLMLLSSGTLVQVDTIGIDQEMYVRTAPQKNYMGQIKITLVHHSNTYSHVWLILFTIMVSGF